MPRPRPPVPVGLVLTGGGARGAYQAGVLRALAERAAALDLPGLPAIITGSSAGAINASYLAARADDPQRAVAGLSELWASLTAEQVYRTDALALGRIGARWLAELSLDGLIAERHANALLDTSPLRALLAAHVPFSQIGEHVRRGRLRGVAITAADYCCGRSRVFFQGEAQPWSRTHRVGEPAELELAHVLASSAIPVLFPPVTHAGHHYGDGSVRNYAPLSPAIKLGARRLIVVGVRPRAGVATPRAERPTIARIGGTILDAVLLDALDLDLEHMQRLNAAVADGGKGRLRSLEACVVRPSEDIGAIAAAEVGSLPRTVRHLLGGLGSPDEAAELISYLLFQPAFTRKLIDLGLRDGRAQAAELDRLLTEPAD